MSRTRRRKPNVALMTALELIEPSGLESSQRLSVQLTKFKSGYRALAPQPDIRVLRRFTEVALTRKVE